MRVCMVAYTYYENDNRVMRYSEALVARGDKVDVVALRQPGQPRLSQYRGVELLRIQKRVMDERKGRLAYLWRLMMFLARSFWVLAWRQLKYRYALIHVHSVPDFQVFSALIPRILGAKVILDIHDIVPEFYASKFQVSRDSYVFRVLVAVERLSISFADHVIVANDIWRERLLSRSATPSRCSTIMNYPDPSIFSQRPRKRRDDRFLMLYPGTINYHQGLDIAVRAFSLIAHEAPEAEFHIYGDGPSRQSLETLIGELGLHRKIVVHGIVPMTEVADLMAEADLGVIPKRNDSFGDEAFSTKSLEFMALGVPLVMSDTTIDTGYFSPSMVQFFKSGDEKDLAAKMLFLCRNPQARMRLSQAGEIFILKNNWGIRKKEYFHLVDRLTEQKDE
jgi:glycosyltransferase involved in cell wall biosynthesis